MFFESRWLTIASAKADKLKIGLVQTNLDAGERYNGTDRFLREHQDMSREIKNAGAVDLIMWPENICTLDPGTLRKGKLSPNVIGDVHIPTLFGAITRVDQAVTSRFYNSAVLADGSGMVLGTYE